MNQPKSISAAHDLSEGACDFGSGGGGEDAHYGGHGPGFAEGYVGAADTAPTLRGRDERVED